MNWYLTLVLSGVIAVLLALLALAIARRDRGGKP